jgi:hypothetical protein
VPTPIVIEVGNIKLKAQLSDTPTAKAIAKSLPLETSFETWGDEYTCAIPIDLPLDDTATLRVSVGDIGYWPTGRAIAIFYGPTPASTGDRPVPPGEVNPVGRILDDPTLLRVVAGVGRLRIRKG